MQRGRDVAEGQDLAENENPPQGDITHGKECVHSGCRKVPSSVGIFGEARTPEPDVDDHCETMRFEKPHSGRWLAPENSGFGPEENQIPRTSSIKKETAPNSPRNSAFSLRMFCLTLEFIASSPCIRPGSILECPVSLLTANGPIHRH